MMRTIAATTLALALASCPAMARQADCPAYAGETIAALAPDFAGFPAFPENPMPTERAEQLLAAVNRATEATGAPHFGAALLTRDGVWSSPEGDRPFAWASVAKLVTATVVLQLADEGVLALDDPVSAYVESVPGGEAITLAMLLAHTGGLRSANEIVDQEGLAPPASLQEELGLLAERGPLFCPGSAWRYSNSGYAVLGAVIAAVDGGDFAASVQRRIAAPLGLATFRIVTDPSDDAFAPLAPPAGEAPVHPAQAGPAGGLVATPREMASFMAALLDGRLLPPGQLGRMARVLYPMFDPGTFYGLGLMAYRVPDGNGATIQWIGHAGGIPGARALLVYDQRADMVIAVALTGSGSAEASAYLLARTASAR